MKAILTKYHGPGYSRGSRMSASDGDNRISIPLEPELSDYNNHIHAALTLAKKLKWSGYLAMGTISKRGKFVANVFVWTDKEALIRVKREEA